MSRIAYLPDTLQFSDYDCGVVCIQTIMAYYGEDINEIRLFAKLKPSKQNGTKVERMANFFKHKGYKVFAGSMNIKRLKSYINKKIPVILLIQAWAPRKVDYTKTENYGHYVIARGYNSKGIIIEDPAIFGQGFLTYKEFLKSWHGEGTQYLSCFGIAVWGKKPYNFKKLIRIR